MQQNLLGSITWYIYISYNDYPVVKLLSFAMICYFQTFVLAIMILIQLL